MMCSGPFSGAQGHTKPQTRAERRSHMDWKRGEVASAANRPCLKPFERPAATSADPENEIATQ